jgi:NADPH-dependent 2,4-dienoyl-CoA reductase/sulfur reductase-like enzyme
MHTQRLLSPDDATPTLRSRHFFDRLAISLCLGHAVKAIRPDERRVMVESSSRGGDAQRAVEYSELVLALGATNRRLQAVKEADELEGVLQLRTVEDAHRLAEEVRGRNVAVIGSGFLGFEIASVVASAAQNVSIYGKAATPLKVLGSEVGNAIRKVSKKEERRKEAIFLIYFFF